MGRVYVDYTYQNLSDTTRTLHIARQIQSRIHALQAIRFGARCIHIIHQIRSQMHACMPSRIHGRIHASIAADYTSDSEPDARRLHVRFRARYTHARRVGYRVGNTRQLQQIARQIQSHIHALHALRFGARSTHIRSPIHTHYTLDLEPDCTLQALRFKARLHVKFRTRCTHARRVGYIVENTRQLQ